MSEIAIKKTGTKRYENLKQSATKLSGKPRIRKHCENY